MPEGPAPPPMGFTGLQHVQRVSAFLSEKLANGLVTLQVNDVSHVRGASLEPGSSKPSTTEAASKHCLRHCGQRLSPEETSQAPYLRHHWACWRRVGKERELT